MIYYGPGNIKCAYCDYVNTCAHDNEKKLRRRMELENIRLYAWVKDAEHAIIARQVERLDCDACGGYIYTTLAEEGIFYEAHATVSSRGICSHCEGKATAFHRERIYLNQRDMHSLDAHTHAFAADSYVEKDSTEFAEAHSFEAVVSNEVKRGDDEGKFLLSPLAGEIISDIGMIRAQEM